MKAPKHEEYNPEMVERLLRLAAEPPAAIFNSFEELMAWLDADEDSKK